MKCQVCKKDHETTELRAKCHPSVRPSLQHHAGPPECIVAKCSVCDAYVAGFLVTAGPFGLGGVQT